MKKSMPEWDLLEIGANLGELEKSPDSRQVFMFSAVTWNRHVIHYNSRSAQSEGLPDVVVQRALIGNYLAQFLEQWLQQKGDILRLEWKVVRSAIPGDTLKIRGVVKQKYVEDNNQLVICEVSIVNQNSDTIAMGEATLKFF
jgi:hydroxyacyl-ACP dehydratase HTD2-like protein with hotdog domain